MLARKRNIELELRETYSLPDAIDTVDIPGGLIETGIHFYIFRPDVDLKDRWIPKRLTEYNYASRTLNIPIFVASEYGLAGQATYRERASGGIEWIPPESYIR